MNRREALASLAVAPVLLSAERVLAEGPVTATLEPKPLSFDPKKLRGISEKLIVSHHDNNYTGAVKNLAKVRAEIAATNKDTPPFLVGALRDRELGFYGSMVMHELYFGNLGGDGKPAGAVVKALPADWEQRMRDTAGSLAGGSGWTTISLVMHTGELQVTWSSNHTQSLATSLPLLVLDMYEHAYQMDYGAAAAKYVDAFFQNVAWAEVDKRYARALKARAALTA